jgi:hypothetical protein
MDRCVDKLSCAKPAHMYLSLVVDNNILIKAVKVEIETEIRQYNLLFTSNQI